MGPGPFDGRQRRLVAPGFAACIMAFLQASIGWLRSFFEPRHDSQGVYGILFPDVLAAERAGEGLKTQYAFAPRAPFGSRRDRETGVWCLCDGRMFSRVPRGRRGSITSANRHCNVRAHLTSRLLGCGLGRQQLPDPGDHQRQDGEVENVIGLELGDHPGMAIQHRAVAVCPSL